MKATQNTDNFIDFLVRWYEWTKLSAQYFVHNVKSSFMRKLYKDCVYRETRLYIWKLHLNYI